MSELDLLKPRDHEYCKLRVRGLSMVEAFARSRPNSKAKRNCMMVEASKLEKQPKIRLRIKELYDSVRIADIDNHAQLYTRVLADCESARKAENWTAMVGLHRLAAQMQGALIDRTHMTFEATLSDDELIDVVSKGDGIIARAMRDRLGKDGFDA